MNNINRAVAEVKDDGPQLQIVPATNGAGKKTRLSAPLVLPSLTRARRPRPELATLAWSHRANRLAGRK
jgi:hypothetical protein